MAESVVLLGLTFHNRFNLHRPPAIGDDDAAARASFTLQRELAPETPSGVVRDLCNEGVRITVSSGSVVVRVEGLTHAAAQKLAATDLGRLSADPDWNLWLERSGARQPKNKPRVLVDDVVWVGHLLGSVAGPDKQAAAMEYRFVPWNASKLSARFAGPLLARHLLHSVRALANDERCMIWFGSAGRDFTYSEFSHAVVEMYSRMFASEKAPLSFSAPTARAPCSRMYTGADGFFVFSQAGLVELAANFVREVVDSVGQEEAGEFGVDFDGDSVVRFRDASQPPHIDAPLLVLFVDATGCEFDKNPQLFQGLLTALQRAVNVRFVSLFGCSMTDEQQALVFGRLRHMQSVQQVLVNECVFEQQQQQQLVQQVGVNRFLDLLVPGAVSSTMIFASERERQAMRARCARMRTLVTASMCRAPEE